MKVVILAGGFGTRIAEETHLRPKPMIEIGGKPLLWHIMKGYSHYGFNEFLICLGYKGYVIKEYFYNYLLHNSDVSFNLASQEIQIHRNHTEPWRVTLVDTGTHTMTGGRVKRIEPFVNGQTFMLTYGDGVANIDILSLLNYHRQHKKIATLTSVQPSGRFGALQLDSENHVQTFQEKPAHDGRWVNGGFFVLEPEVFRHLEGDDTILEREPLEILAAAGQLKAFKHTGFWHCMDTLRDKEFLSELWQSGQAHWKVW